ncbi:MAG: beta-N-acetylhexosaminidase [Acidobacteria bacterium]|nr:beta-N-acetylhexosaminidase [Acidobacteriota bacterium]
MSLSRLLLLPLAASLACSAAVAQQGNSVPLIPKPREATFAAPLNISSVEVVCKDCDADDTFAANELKETLAQRGISVSNDGDVKITLLRASTSDGKKAIESAHLTWAPEMDAEGYLLVPNSKGITVVGASPSGVFYGAQTVKQLIDSTNKPAVLHPATIRDWPAMKTRGLDDDLSRGPVPTLEFQKKLIRTLAAYKVNLYSPYFEHTMQYASQPLVAPKGGSISAADARELVAYAKPYHILIVPEQEAFGHLHYMLNWEQYSNLAETPHGQVLAPGQPGSIEVTKSMFQELANIYPGPYLHVGADETFELGKGQTKADVDARGLGAVYLDYMKQIVAALKPLHRKLLFWGDIAMHDPDLVKALPQDFKNSTIAVAWTYNPQPNGFDRWIKPFTDAGMECWVSPGVNNWNRVYPNNNMALQNIARFTADGQKYKCTGQMNTIWNDDGEGLINMDWYGILFGAAAAWQPGLSDIPTYEASYGRVFHGDLTGKIDEAQKELMAVHQILKDNYKIADATNVIFWNDPWSPDGVRQGNDLRPYLHDIRMHAERALILIAQARNTANLREQDALDAMELGARRMDLLAFKYMLSDEIATYYATAERLQSSKDRKDHSEVSRSLGAINGVNGKLQDLRDGYTFTRDLYSQAWLKSNKPYWLYNNIARYDMTVQMWIERIDKLRAVQRQWGRDHTIPPAASIGIPPAPPATTTTPAAAPAL